DAQWRFRLTPELAAWAGLEGDVVVVGVRDHLEVWAVERWQRYIAQCDCQYEQLAESALEDQPNHSDLPTAQESSDAGSTSPNGAEQLYVSRPPR
ncbi:MAG: hypothetical protein DCC67_11875, partial [Planctomycetota bacterium]